MSEENLEKIRRAYTEFSETFELPWEITADDAELDGTGAMPDVGVVTDRETGQAAIRSYAEMFESYSVTLDEVIHASEELVVTAVTDGGRIRGSSHEVHNRFFHCFEFCDGLVVRWSAHTSRADALAAAGLSG